MQKVEQKYEYKTYDADSVFPSLKAPFFIEHMARYIFAQNFVKNKDVMELGCGKGYGSFLLAKVAKKTVAIDLNDESLKFAKNNYAAPNLEYVKGSVFELEKYKGQFDAVVAFEIIEHLSPKEVEDFLIQAKLCLKSGGLFLVSTPNHDVVLKSGMPVPEFHINNLGSKEFKTVLSRHFLNVQVYGQAGPQNFIKRVLLFMDFLNLRHSFFIKGLRKFLKKETSNSIFITDKEDYPVWSFNEGISNADKYYFSKHIYRQSGTLFAVCKN